MKPMLRFFYYGIIYANSVSAMINNRPVTVNQYDFSVTSADKIHIIINYIIIPIASDPDFTSRIENILLHHREHGKTEVKT